MQKDGRSKSGIDRIRESAGAMTVGDDSDGAIVSMATIENRLYAIKEGAVYAIAMADDIDPERTREDIPNTVQKVFDVGASSDIVQRLLLTGIELFRKNRLHERVDYEAALNIIVEIMRDVLAAADICEEIDAALKRVDVASLTSKERALALPSVPGLRSKIKSFVQKMDHAMQSVFDLTCVFYDRVKLRKAGKWLDGFANHLEGEQNLHSDFAAFARELAAFSKSVRNTRHCIEHPKPTQQLTIVDFSLSAKAELVEPTITVVHDTTPFDTSPVLEFMRYFIDQTVAGVEMLMVFLAGHHVAPLGGFEIGVGEVPEGQRQLGVRYGYLANFGGQLTKLS
jgi:hypothetical protein